MGLKEKLEKIRESRVMKAFELRDDEKTGVLNGLIMLSAFSGALFALQSGAHATPPCIDQPMNDAGVVSNDIGQDSGAWNNHSWCWTWSWGWGAGT